MEARSSGGSQRCVSKKSNVTYVESLVEFRPEDRGDGHKLRQPGLGLTVLLWRDWDVMV